MSHNHDDPKRCFTCAPLLNELRQISDSMHHPTKTEKAEVRRYLMDVPGWSQLDMGENEDGSWCLAVGDHFYIEADSAPEVLRALAAVLEEN